MNAWLARVWETGAITYGQLTMFYGTVFAFIFCVICAICFRKQKVASLAMIGLSLFLAGVLVGWFRI